MQKLIFHQSEVFEKIVRDARGGLFCVRFVVVDRGGILRGRIISCISLHGLLEGAKPQAAFHTVKKLGGIVASPYFNKFQFLTAIQIRAPSLYHF